MLSTANVDSSWNQEPEIPSKFPKLMTETQAPKPSFFASKDKLTGSWVRSRDTGTSTGSSIRDMVYALNRSLTSSTRTPAPGLLSKACITHRLSELSWKSWYFCWWTLQRQTLFPFCSSAAFGYCKHQNPQLLHFVKKISQISSLVAVYFPLSSR